MTCYHSRCFTSVSYFEERKLIGCRPSASMENWREWLQFLLHAVAVQAADAVERAVKLADLRESYRQRLLGTRSRAREVVDLLSENPVLTTKFVVRRLNMTSQGRSI